MLAEAVRHTRMVVRRPAARPRSLRLMPIMAPAISVKTKRMAISVGPISICTHVCYDLMEDVSRSSPGRREVAYPLHGFADNAGTSSVGCGSPLRQQIFRAFPAVYGCRARAFVTALFFGYSVERLCCINGGLLGSGRRGWSRRRSCGGRCGSCCGCRLCGRRRRSRCQRRQAGSSRRIPSKLTLPRQGRLFVQFSWSCCLNKIVRHPYGVFERLPDKPLGVFTDP